MATYYANSEVGICNMALSRIGDVNPIQSLDTTADGSVEASQCAIFYPSCRDEVLTDFPWTWAQGVAQLDLVNTTTPATPEYQYQYQYPASALQVLSLFATPVQTPIQNGIPITTGFTSIPAAQGNQWWLRPEGRAYPIPFRINSGATGRLISTDYFNSNGVSALITQQIVDVTQYSADFVSMLAWRLAIELAFALAISDDRRESAHKAYKSESAKTRARLSNESQNDIPYRRFNSEFVRNRH